MPKVRKGSVVNKQILEKITFTIPERKGFRETHENFKSLIDTGASISCICKNFATTNRLRLIGDTDISTANGVVQRAPLYLVQFNNEHVLMASYTSSGSEFKCLLGMDLIKELHIVDNDYELILHHE